MAVPAAGLWGIHATTTGHADATGARLHLQTVIKLSWLLWIPLQLLGLGTSAVHAETASADSFVSLQMENDFFASSGDRYYTHGTQLSVLKEESPPRWLHGLTEWLPLYQQGGGLNLVNYTLGQKIFTPDDTESKTVVEGERPYAGYLYASVAVLSQIYSTSRIDHGNVLEVTFGVVGPSAMSEEAQTGFHDRVGIDSPNGWDNQLEDEPALGFSYTRFWRVVQPLSGDLEFGFNPHLNAVVGNVYTYGAGGVSFRLGDNLRRDLAPPNIRPGFPGMPYFRGAQEASWYLFMGFESRLVARDIFLDGNTFAQSHSVDKEYLVGDMQFGLVSLSGNWRVAFSNMVRTREYASQEENTHYGAVNVSYRY